MKYEPKEDWIEKFILSLIKKNPKKLFYSNRDIFREIIMAKKCTMLCAKSFFKEMMDLGLELCVDERSLGRSEEYNLKQFALLRGY